MPFLKFSRDKRGYENTYLMHAVTRRGKPARTRILYWYRTPPGIRVGRLPFDDEVRRTIEVRNPGVVFNWDALAATPIPPPDNTEHWRERRRLEKAAKLARRQEEVEGDAEPADDDIEDAGETSMPATAEAAAEMSPEGESQPRAADAAGAEPEDGANRLPGNGPGAARRRRRRGGRRRGAAAPLVAGASDAATQESTASDAAPSMAPDSSSEEE